MRLTLVNIFFKKKKKILSLTSTYVFFLFLLFCKFIQPWRNFLIQLLGQNGQIPSILEIFCLETLFRKNIVIYHFFWYSNLVSLNTIFFNLPWHDNMESWIKKIKKWPFSTRALWARVLYVVPESIKLGYHSVLAPSFIWTSLLTLSTFWNPAYPHSHSLLSHHSLSHQSPSHSRNLPLNLDLKWYVFANMNTYLPA